MTFFLLQSGRVRVQVESGSALQFELGNLVSLVGADSRSKQRWQARSRQTWNGRRRLIEAVQMDDSKGSFTQRS